MVLQNLMEADVDGLIAAGRYERSGERSTYRNGHRERSLDTRLGALHLKIPKLRPDSYVPGFLEPRKTVEKALVAVIREAWIAGVSTRRVDDLAQAMRLSGISKSSVSKLCKDIDERVNAFLTRPLSGAWPYLWLDATHLKVREGGRIVSVAAIVAVAVDTEGRREIVGLHIGPSEADVFWTDFLRSLVKHGLPGVDLVVSDAHEGSEGRHPPRAEVDLAKVPRSLNPERPGLRAARSADHGRRRSAPRLPAARSRAAGAALERLAEQLHARWPKLKGFIDATCEDVIAYLAFRIQHRTKLHSTNPSERFNKGTMRRADVVAIFPNTKSLQRLDQRGVAGGQRRAAASASLHASRGHGRACPGFDRRDAHSSTPGHPTDDRATSTRKVHLIDGHNPPDRSRGAVRRRRARPLGIERSCLLPW